MRRLEVILAGRPQPTKGRADASSSARPGRGRQNAEWLMLRSNPIDPHEEVIRGRPVVPVTRFRRNPMITQLLRERCRSSMMCGSPYLQPIDPGITGLRPYKRELLQNQ